MYREAIKVLDCTIRDGGLINDHYFEDDLVKEVFKVVNNSGVDYMEIGYRCSKNILSPDKFGKWKFCEEDMIKSAIDGQEKRTKISVMCDIGRIERDEIPEKKDSVIDMMRVATYVKDVDKAIDMVNDFTQKGYETTINIMAVSKALDNELDEALHQLEEECKTDVIYVVDSFGHFYCENITYLVNKYKTICKTKEIGIHMHNNQQLAYGNTIQGIIDGGNFLDASIYGIGRGAGNCPLELLIGFLKNPKYDIRPILEVIEKKFIPLLNDIEWGYLIPYAVTGMLNEHPRSAMAMRKTADKDKYLEFFDSFASMEMD